MRVPVIEVREQDGAVIATVQDQADIDIAYAAELGEMLIEAVPNHAVGLVLDLSTTRYVDSAGIRMLFGLARQLLAGRHGLAICVPDSSPLVRLVQITQLGEVAVICPTVEACIKEMSDRTWR